MASLRAFLQKIVRKFSEKIRIYLCTHKCLTNIHTRVSFNMKPIVFIIISICLFIMCSRYDLDELLAAPEKIEIDSREYVLDAGLGRDGVGSLLYASTYIIAVDSQPFPSSLDADSMYVINEGDVWAVALIDGEPPPEENYKIRKHAKDEGPEWGPDIYVDVVVRLVDPDSFYLLKQSDVLISVIY